MHASAIIREARAGARLTQQELAALAGTTQSAISRLERGRIEPTLETLERLVAACGFVLDIRLTAGSQPVPDLESNLSLTPTERLDQLARTVSFMRAGREAMVDALV